LAAFSASSSRSFSSRQFVDAASANASSTVMENISAMSLSSCAARVPRVCVRAIGAVRREWLARLTANMRRSTPDVVVAS